jgi:hypothetical protein
MFRRCFVTVNARLICGLGLRELPVRTHRSFRKVAQRVSFNQAVEFFGEILGVIAGALQRLRHEQNIEAQRIFLARVVGKVALEHRVADIVEFGVHA